MDLPTRYRCERLVRARIYGGVNWWCSNSISLLWQQQWRGGLHRRPQVSRTGRIKGKCKGFDSNIWESNHRSGELADAPALLIGGKGSTASRRVVDIVTPRIAIMKRN